MTLAIIGIFLLHAFNAHWGWYVAVTAAGLIEAFFTDDARRRALERLGEIRNHLERIAPDDED